MFFFGEARAADVTVGAQDRAVGELRAAAEAFAGHAVAVGELQGLRQRRGGGAHGKRHAFARQAGAHVEAGGGRQARQGVGVDVHGDGRCVCGVGARGVAVGGDEAVERVFGGEFAAQFVPQRRSEVFFAALGVTGGEQDFGERVLSALCAQEGFDVRRHGAVGVGKEAGLSVVEGECGIVRREFARAGVDVGGDGVLVVAVIAAGEGGELLRVVAVDALLECLAVDGEAFSGDLRDFAEVLAAQEDGREFAGEFVPAAAVGVVGQLPEEEGGGAGEQHRRDVPARRARGAGGFAVAQVFQGVVEAVVVFVLVGGVGGVLFAPGSDERALFVAVVGGIGCGMALAGAQQRGEGGEGEQ